MRLVDLTGSKFGRFTVIRRAEKNKRGRPAWICVCDCGNEVIAQGNDLRIGDTKSCGCFNMDNITVHGLHNHPLYQTWNGMMFRCYNKVSKDYHNYGGRGIKVYNGWHDVTKFISDIEVLLGNRPNGCSIDRINNNEGYEPSNVRWATASEQSINQRPRKNNTSLCRGVYWNKKTNKWRAHIKNNGKDKHLGTFGCIEDAIVARKNAEKEIWI